MLLCEVLILEKVHGYLLIADALDVEHDSNTGTAGRAEIAVEGVFRVGHFETRLWKRGSNKKKIVNYDSEY